jgi:hypothetical protein
MGVDESEPPTGFVYRDVQIVGTPGDYFEHIALDTFQVSVRGGWLVEDGSTILLDLKEAAELAKADKGTHVIQGPNGVDLVVYPHGARPTYRVLLRSPDGIEIRALPEKAGMPTFLIRFGARECVEWTLQAIGLWIHDLLEGWGFAIESIHLSEVHLRRDDPEPFTETDQPWMRGHATRNGKVTIHHAIRRGRLTVQTITNIGGQKVMSFALYDKRAEQKDRQGVFWPAVWKAYQISDECPIWRAEFRFKRKKLLELGFDRFEELGTAAFLKLWYYATEKHLSFVQEDADRPGHERATKRWCRLAEGGLPFKPVPIRFRVGVEDSMLFKQVKGTLARLVERAGLTILRDIDRVVVAAIRGAEGKSGVQIVQAAEEAFASLLLGVLPTMSDVERNSLRKLLLEEVVRSVETWPRRRPFSEGLSAGGSS